MIPTLKSEAKKLLSIRSTYIVSGLVLLLVAVISFYFVGVRADDMTSPFVATTVKQTVLNMMMLVGTLVGVVAILHICHEYRYNTIAYTLTASNNRLKVLAAKIIVISTYATVMALLTIILAAFMSIIGANAGGATVAPQDFSLWDIVWRADLYMIGGALIGLLLGFLFRSQVFSIAAYFVLPMVESILTFWLKLDANWMPNSAQSQILMSSGNTEAFSPVASAGVMAMYLVGGWIIAAVLFKERDAN